MAKRGSMGTSKKLLITLIIFILLISGWHFVARQLLDRIPPINGTTKTCLITGTSSGIGREIAREMVKRGWLVLGIARQQKKLLQVSQELGEKFIPYTCNVSDAGAVHLISEQIKKQQFKPTLFFLNAGTGTVEEKFKLMSDIHKQTFATNYFGVISWIDEWINQVKTYGGATFVATSSVASLFATPGSASYSASKVALNNCFQALALQYHNDTIGFVIVMPGPVATEMLKTDKPIRFTHTPETEARYIVRHVFKREKQIEPSWYYSITLRFLDWLPAQLAIRILS